MNIDGLGAESVELLFKNGLIENFADLYELKAEQIMPLERMAAKSASNMIRGIEASKKIPFEKVLFALGIRFVGETVAKKLARHYKNIDALIQASYEELIEVDEIGEKIAQSIVAYFSDEGNILLIDRIKAYGLKLSVDESLFADQTDLLKGQVFVVSGVFQMMTRNELEKAIEDNGGKVSGSISKKTNFVIAGDKMGPSKKEKAEKLGISMIKEQDFLEMLSND
jgi:DNA ligase (NAD+)